MYRRLGKRILDLAFTVLALVFLAPIMISVSILVYLKLGSPILFCQRRPGKHGKTFVIYKFRSMTDERDAKGDLLSDEERLTSFGCFLRATSLDELPELFNVLKGDMSLVGPRPLRIAYLPLYTQQQARRHDVMPGITGWAQVNGRNTLDWEERFDLDVWYVDNQSLWLDLKILFMTVLIAFKREGISAEGEVTMYPFKGTKE